MTAATLVGGAALTGAFLAARFHVAKPNQFLVRTGYFIKNRSGMSVGKRCIQWPMQQVTRVDMNPETISFVLHNMSKEKVENALPLFFTIAPAHPHDDPETFERYATMMTEMDHDEIYRTIQGIVEGETRGLTSQLTVEEIFNAKDAFREQVVTRIAEDLKKLGIEVLNANIQEMRDYDENNKYFEFRKQRAIETANYEAQVDVSEAKRQGDIGMKRNESEARMRTAELEMEATLRENETRQQVAASEADLQRACEVARQTAEVAKVEADNTVRMRLEQMEREVEEKRQEKLLAQHRAEEFSTVQVNAEKARECAKGEADAVRIRAEADLYAKQQEAEGIRANLEAHATGIERMLASAEPDLVKFYLADKSGLLVNLARAQGEAYRDMKPDITVWQTGATDTSVSGVLGDIARSVVPVAEAMSKKGLTVPFYEAAIEAAKK